MSPRIIEILNELYTTDQEFKDQWVDWSTVVHYLRLTPLQYQIDQKAFDDDLVIAASEALKE